MRFESGRKRRRTGEDSTGRGEPSPRQRVVLNRKCRAVPRDILTSSLCSSLDRRVRTSWYVHFAMVSASIRFSCSFLRVVVDTQQLVGKAVPGKGGLDPHFPIASHPPAP